MLIIIVVIIVKGEIRYREVYGVFGSKYCEDFDFFVLEFFRRVCWFFCLEVCRFSDIMIVF